MVLEVAYDLVEEGAHFHERLSIGRASNHTAVVVAQHHDRGAQQVWAEHSLAACIKAVAVHQCINRLSHG
ncbi:hypothetical protein D9M70_588380 [compost metagenome]